MNSIHVSVWKRQKEEAIASGREHLNLEFLAAMDCGVFIIEPVGEPVLAASEKAVKMFSLPLVEVRWRSLAYWSRAPRTRR